MLIFSSIAIGGYKRQATYTIAATKQMRCAIEHVSSSGGEGDGIMKRPPSPIFLAHQVQTATFTGSAPGVTTGTSEMATTEPKNRFIGALTRLFNTLNAPKPGARNGPAAPT